MKIAWFLSVSQAPAGLCTLTITVKTRPYHFFLPSRAFRTEQEALTEASSLIQASVFAKLLKGSPLCSSHPAYGHWQGGEGGNVISSVSSPITKDWKDVPRSLIGVQ
jgi:hypothetical protein